MSDDLTPDQIAYAKELAESVRKGWSKRPDDKPAESAQGAGRSKGSSSPP
jgi:hypothetical protein